MEPCGYSPAESDLLYIYTLVKEIYLPGNDISIIC